MAETTDPYVMLADRIQEVLEEWAHSDANPTQAQVGVTATVRAGGAASVDVFFVQTPPTLLGSTSPYGEKQHASI